MKLIGEGQMGWYKFERQTDRYGSIFLHGAKLQLPEQGAMGKLVAEVVEKRPHIHLGDWFNGVGTSEPQINKKITLGEGAFFWNDREEDLQFGVEPRVQRDHEWLDGPMLYQMNNQLIRVYFQHE